MTGLRLYKALPFSLGVHAAVFSLGIAGSTPQRESGAGDDTIELSVLDGSGAGTDALPSGVEGAANERTRHVDAISSGRATPRSEGTVPSTRDERARKRRIRTRIATGESDPVPNAISGVRPDSHGEGSHSDGKLEAAGSADSDGRSGAGTMDGPPNAGGTTDQSGQGQGQGSTAGGLALRKLSGEAPRYPVVARRQGVEGSVVVRLTIDVKGHVSDATIVQSFPSGLFEQAALEAIQTWRFAPNPSLSSEKKVHNTVADVELKFRLSEP